MHVTTTADPPVAGGIAMKNQITMTLKSEQMFPKKLPMLLLSFCGLFGTFFSVINMFQLPCYDPQVIFYLLICWGGVSALTYAPKRCLLLLIPLLLVYELLLMRNWTNFTEGFMHVFNCIYAELRHTNADYYVFTSTDIPYASITDFFSFLALPFSLVICFSVSGKINFLLCFLMTFPAVELGLYEGLVPTNLDAAMLFVFWIGTFSAQISAIGRRGGSKQVGFYRKGNRFLAKGDMRFQLPEQTAWVMILVTAALFHLALLGLRIANYSRPEQLDTIRHDFLTAVSEFRMNDIPSSLERIQSAFGIQSKADKTYTLGNVSSMKFKNQTMLEVTFSEPLTYQIYLRGYTGAIYDGSSWEALSSSDYESGASVFTALSEASVSPQHFQAISVEAASHTAFRTTPHMVSVTVAPKQDTASYAYAAYGALGNSLSCEYDTVFTAASSENDLGAVSVNQYTYQMADARLLSDSGLFPYTDSATILNSGDPLFLPEIESEETRNRCSVWSQNEYAYREFVYDTYLGLPASDSLQIIFDTYQKEMTANDPLERLSQIKALLQKDCTYSLSPGTTPGNRDFVEYFLLENQKGYCVHFATAGVVLCRMAGIPARFVTGYAVPMQAMTNAEPDQPVTVSIPDNAAHAWTEVYLDGVGWIPYEFTPGYQGNAVITTAATANTTRVTTTTTTTVKTTAQTSRSTAQRRTTPAQTTTAAPVVSSTVTTVANGGGTGLGALKFAVKLTILLCLAFCLGFALLVLKNRRAAARRNQQLSQEDPNAVAIYAYQYLCRLLEFQKIKDTNQHPEHFAEEAERQCPYLNPGELVRAAEIALCADYSQHGISKNDADFIADLARRLAKTLLHAASRDERFLLRYWNCLAD